MEHSTRQMRYIPLEQTDPPQSWQIEWQETDIEAETRRREQWQVLGIILSLLAIAFSTVSLMTAVIAR